jgi:ubiquinone/menaquinone biosynthesis C-methylase UbiE
MDPEAHWETLYRTKTAEQVSWYRRHLDVSLNLIERAAPARSEAIIDVGGGESTLVDDLLERGFSNLTVLDISAAALEVTKQRLGSRAGAVGWIAADIRNAVLPDSSCDVWHDRAVFHFLTTQEDRRRYVHQVLRAVRPGGYVIVGAFGPDGPRRCSGLEVVRYEAAGLHGQFGSPFRLVESVPEVHVTPWGTTQQFVYCLCMRMDPGAF